jgi:transcriptional regulator with XRE-family HTH domain
MGLRVVGGREYGARLAACRRAAGMSQREVAERAHMDNVSVSRSEAGARAPAGPDEVLMLAEVLALTPAQRDDLLVSAGFWPIAFHNLGPADPTLRALAEALDGPPSPERQELRTAVHSLLRLASPLLVSEAPPAPPVEGFALRRGRRPGGA